MYRNDIPLIPAELIGYHLGLVVPESERQYFWQGRTGEIPKAGWGTQIYKPEYSPNVAFKKLGIPLRMNMRFISTFPDVASLIKYLESVQKDDLDVLTCFDYGVLHDTDYHGGHVCVVDKVFLDENKVRVIDTEYQSPKWRMVDISKLYEAMKEHGDDKSGGMWELKVAR